MQKLLGRTDGTRGSKLVRLMSQGLLPSLTLLLGFSACEVISSPDRSGGCLDTPSGCETPLTCGNGKVEGDELCDKTDFNGESCKTLGDGLYTGGTLRCSSKCTFDVSLCVGIGVELCTDGIDNDKDGDTDCQDADCAAEASCQDLGGTGGQAHDGGGQAGAAGDTGFQPGLGGAGSESGGAGSESGGAGGQSGGAGGQSGGVASKWIYLTAMPKKANFGGITGADALCNASPPRAGAYKALIVDGTARRACTTASCSGGVTEHIDWVLAPDTSYSRPDGTLIGTTNEAGIFVFPLEASIATAGYSYWTGLGSDWTSSSDDCGDWTQTAGYAATEGLGDATDSQAIYGVSESCATLAGAFFACVEQ